MPCVHRVVVVIGIVYSQVYSVMLTILLSWLLLLMAYVRALKTHLFQSYCLGLYGGALWNLSSGPVRALEVSYNNILRRIWSLPRTAHTAVIHSVAELKSVFNLLYCKFLKLVSIALNHDSCWFSLCLGSLFSHALTSLAIIFCTVFVMSTI